MSRTRNTSRVIKYDTNCHRGSEYLYLPDGPSGKSNSDIQTLGNTFTKTVQTIVDYNNARWRARYRGATGYEWVKYPAMPCTHTKSTVDHLHKPFSVVGRYDVPDYLLSSVTNYLDVAAFWHQVYSGSVSHSNLLLIDNAFSLDAYSEIDWTSIRDSFLEALDSIVATSFFFGESAVESGIYFDAIKLLINPSSSIKTLLKVCKKYYKKGRVLGSLKGLLRGTSSGIVQYKFAIEPAIQNVRDALSAHQVVSQRMDYLRKHKGQFVPIRVGRKFSSDFSNDSISNPSSGYTLYKHVSERTAIGRASCLARVREDVSLLKPWQAYLEYFGVNKVVGLAWELIPFSFVIDWFTNAQERINSLTRIRVSNPFSEIININYSQKFLTKYDLKVNFGSTCPGIAGGQIPVEFRGPHTVGNIISSSYQRGLMPFDTTGVWSPSNLGVGHAITSGALGFLLATK